MGLVTSINSKAGYPDSQRAFCFYATQNSFVILSLFLAQKSPLLSVIVLVEDIYSVPFTAMLNVIFKLIPLFFV